MESPTTSPSDPVFAWEFGPPLSASARSVLRSALRAQARRFWPDWPAVLGVSEAVPDPVALWQALGERSLDAEVGTPLGDVLGILAILITNLSGSGGFWTGIEWRDGALVPSRIKEQESPVE